MTLIDFIFGKSDKEKAIDIALSLFNSGKITKEEFTSLIKEIDLEYDY